MNKLIPIIAIACSLSACSGKQTYRDQCKAALDSAWEQLDIAKAEGFSGSVSYTKALGLLTSAKTMQTVENFDNCVGQANKANYYIQQSFQGK